MKIVITGGAGFIGSHITESLVKQGHEVTVFDNFYTGRKENLTEILSDIRIVEGDIMDVEALKKAFKGADLVSHQAAQLEIFRSTDEPLFDLEVNTIGTLNVLKAAKEEGVSKIVNASSACIYGQVEGTTNEMHYPRPNWAYGVSKLAAEKYCDVYSDYQQLPVVNLRYGITYGEREWYRRVLTIMCKRVINNQPPVVFGNGEQVRDFIYVKDLVDLHNITLFNEKANGHSYNVGTGVGTSIKDLAQKVIEASNKNLDVLFENTQEGEFSKLVPDKKRNTAELKVMLLDISKAKNELNWQPKTVLVDGLRNEINWATANINRWEKVFYSKI
ncbi:MAG: NAD-dependent epimerase/dehydratase family protein [Bacteroidota bacterium]|jgi:UDP-glucose 4-epimerase